MSSRQAALLIHALSASDRDWVMRRLGDAEGAHMRELLAELESLGIPEDTALVDAALVNPGAGAAKPLPDDDEALLMQAEPAVLAELLHGEPTAFVRKLLADAEWPWSEELATRLSLPASGVAAPQSAPAFRQCATRLIARRLRERGVPALAPNETTKTTARAPTRWTSRLGALWRRAG